MKSKEGRKTSRRPPPPPTPPRKLETKKPPTTSTPDIVVNEAPIGRDTLQVVWEERRQQSEGQRAPFNTFGYEEVPMANASPPARAPTSPRAASPQRGASSPKRPAVPSVPEISISESTIGRQTIIDINEAETAGLPPPKRPPMTSTPDITVEEATIGLRTLLDIRELEAGGKPPGRGPMMPSTPEISVTETPIGRQTLADIKEAIAKEEPLVSRLIQTKRFDEADVLELFTFVVTDRTLSVAATEEEKWDFVRQRLTHRLPKGIGNVRRVDIKPADPTALMVRIWCEVPFPPKR